MTQSCQTPDHSSKQTKSAFLWTRLLSIPFWSIISMLSFILYKDMQITPLQITTIVAMKPMSALLASYWSISIHHRQDRLRSNLIYANILRFLPFLFFPWIDSAWVMIFAFGIYWMLTRGVTPAWMEIFKLNIKDKSRERTFAFVSSLDYLGAALMPLIIGKLLDEFYLSWRWIFPVTALMGLASTYFLYRIPSSVIQEINQVLLKKSSTLSEQIAKPWKDCWVLLKERPDFAKFQVGFLFGGAGLMMMQSAQPIFFVDQLHLSFTEMAFAMTLCKGIGFAASSPLWVRIFGKIDIFYFTGLVTILAGLFPFFLIGAEYHLLFLYFAYMMYGLMQGGSELSWHMSGPLFAKEGDSSVYSRTNVLTVGVRGCVAPYLGSLLLYMFNSSTLVLLCGSFLCFVATERMMRYSKEVRGLLTNIIP
jgi:F0F1-type ATP synthase assembly protein I